MPAPTRVLSNEQQVLAEKIVQLRKLDAKTLWRPAALLCASTAALSGAVTLLVSTAAYFMNRVNDQQRSLVDIQTGHVEPLTPLEDAFRTSAARYAAHTGEALPHLIFLHSGKQSQTIHGMQKVVSRSGGIAGEHAVWFMLKGVHDSLSGPRPPRHHARIQAAEFDYLKDPDKLALIDYLVAHELKHVKRKDVHIDNISALSSALTTATATSAITTAAYALPIDIANVIAAINTPLLAAATVGWKPFIPHALATLAASAGLLYSLALKTRATNSAYNIELGADVEVARTIGLDRTITALFTGSGAQYGLAAMFWRSYKNETDAAQRARHADTLLDMVQTTNSAEKRGYENEHKTPWPKHAITEGDRLTEMLTLYRAAASRPVQRVRITTTSMPPIK